MPSIKEILSFALIQDTRDIEILVQLIALPAESTSDNQPLLTVIANNIKWIIL
jgi:hypothetical protein